MLPSSYLYLKYKHFGGAIEGINGNDLSAFKNILIIDASPKFGVIVQKLGTLLELGDSYSLRQYFISELGVSQVPFADRILKRHDGTQPKCSDVL